MLNNCKWKEETPFVCHAAYRGVISAINFQLITTASQQLRQEQNLNPGGGGIDAYNELLAAREESAEEERSLEEQGLPKGPTPRVVGGMLKAIAAYLNDELLEHATPVELITTGKTVPNPWEVGENVAMTLQRQVIRSPREMTSQMKLEAKALNVSEEVIAEAIQRQQHNNAAFLTNNREALLSIIDSMVFENPDELAVEAIWRQLPVMLRFRLFAAADSGLYFASTREATRYILQGRLESKSNVGLIDGERRVLRQEINDFLSDPKNKREIREAIDGGAVIPVLRPVPPAAVAVVAAAA